MLAICWLQHNDRISATYTWLWQTSRTTWAITAITILPRVHELSFRNDKGGEYQTTPLRTLSPMAQTSSDTEVVVNLLVRAFDGEHGDEMPHHIVTTAKSVLNLYLHAVFGMILSYRNHNRNVADRGRRNAQLLRWDFVHIIKISVS